MISGKRKIVITGAKGTFEGIKAYAEKRGLVPIPFPVIKIKPVKFTVKKREYDWVIFTSRNAVENFTEKAGKVFFKALKIGSIGGQTAALLKKKGLKSSFVPDKFNSADFIGEFTRTYNLKGKRVLLPVSSKAGLDIERGLAGAGAFVDRLVVYENTSERISAKQARAFVKKGPFYFILFASPSAFENFTKIKGMRGLLEKTFTAAIGPATAACMKKNRVEPEIICATSTMKNAVDGIINYKGGKK